MKKFIFTIMMVLPLMTWQTYNMQTKVLTVYKGADATTGIYYQGDGAKYDGSATQPVVSPWTASYPLVYGTSSPAK